jgi:transcriptional antiterminator NusG
MAKEVTVDTKKDVIEAIEKHPEKRWYIVQTASKSEDAAKRNIFEQLKVRQSEDLVGMILVPEKKVVEMKNGEKKISKKKNYPGYIFVLANMDEKVMMSIREASKVLSFVEGNGEKLPNAMKTKDINEVLNQLDVDSEVAPTHKTEFNVDEQLLITAGPFESFTGVVKSVNYDKEELELSILIFGRETPVNIGFKHVARAV